MTRRDERALFESVPVPRALASLALPTIAGQLIILIYSLADTFFIGRLNDPSMVAGAAVILPVFNICVPLSALAGIGGGSLISRLLGAKQPDAASRVSSFSLAFSAALALSFSVLCAAFMDELLAALGTSGDVARHARLYADSVLVVGALPTVMTITMANLLRSVGRARDAGFGVSMGGVVNIALDPLLMFVLFPREMAALAAGAATMTSNLIAFVWFAVKIFRLRERTVLRLLPRDGVPTMEHVFSILYVGIPSALTTLLFDLDYMVIGRLMSAYGHEALAAIGIVLRAERLPLNVGVGICLGMMPLVAYSRTSGDHERMRHAANFARLVGLAFAAASVAMYELLAPSIMRAFIEDAQTIAIGTDLLRVRAIATPLMFICFHLVFFFQGIGMGGSALLLGVSRWAVFNIPMLFIMEAALGMYGIVWAQTAADICTISLSYAVYRRSMRSLSDSCAR